MDEWKVLTNGQLLVEVNMYVALGIEQNIRKHHRDWSTVINYEDKTLNIKTAPNSVYSGL